MTAGEFKAWLRGYLEAGGKDVNRIQEEAEKMDVNLAAWPGISSIEHTDTRPWAGVDSVTVATTPKDYIVT